ncbi:uncharacterized protein [Asterias amurensis]|uniref:uncharacterized protein n=1 Tax=Asterias amurensis TaxID=7602 RepID=UPI003AB71232
MATSKKGKRGHVYICCNYSPPGNWRGAENYIENVPPLLPNIGSLEPINVENENFEDEDSIDDKDELEKATPAPSGVNMTHLERIRLEVLEMHNVYRAKHGVPTLTPSKKINKYAQRWAETMAKTGKFEHSSNGQRPNCGENIYFAGSTNFDLANITVMQIIIILNWISDTPAPSPHETRGSMSDGDRITQYDNYNFQTP